MKQINAPESSIRGGVTTAEVLVAATLLLGMIGVVVPTTVRAGKIWHDTRQYQLATNELSNQFEMLSSLSPDELSETLKQLKVAEHLEARLPNASLTGALQQDADGYRLTLEINWDRGANAQPLRLTGWLLEQPTKTENKDAPDESK